ncbi:alkylhydroperoxidase family enzyme [Amycolatopsis lexingtonensis]|uniref:Alkylhydroperoxidase family enzyme n=1 Tax=Amycolatopsis lexingtonensis TaxID=218822 RepID=A0ABR9HSQ5_9PSEU|nr:carboxymuconolactone decarboxylase family protein [Amycolatopsis lexingtonensis]MBE1493960.1 alkylhydroperoxidase family enzyme [Amycolatopsis lexingtonensis]
MSTTHATRITDDLLLHHPALAVRYQPFGLSFLTDGILPARERELVILRTSWHCRSPYEWAHHTKIGRECGISTEELRRITTADLREWPGPDAELLGAVVRDHSLSEAQWANLSGRYGTAGAIETVMLAGHYAMLAGVLNSAGTRIEPSIEALVPLS